MTEVLSWATRVESRHVLFLFDNCFSGTIFESKSLPKQSPLIQAYTAKPVRQFITAGSAEQEVPGKSVFTPTFIRALRGEGDLNRDGYVTGSELGMYISDKVANYDNGKTTPQYGKIRAPELDQGDFIFTLTNNDHHDSAERISRWQEVRQCTDLNKLHQFIRDFPKGTATQLARDCVTVLENSLQPLFIETIPKMPPFASSTIKRRM